MHISRGSVKHTGDGVGSAVGALVVVQEGRVNAPGSGVVYDTSAAPVEGGASVVTTGVVVSGASVGAGVVKTGA